MKDEKKFAKLSIVISIIILLASFFIGELGYLFTVGAFVFFIFGILFIISIFAKIHNDLLVWLFGLIIAVAGGGSINDSPLALLIIFDGMCICGIAYERLKREDKNIHKSFDYISNSSETYKKMFLEINRDKFSREEKRLFLEKYKDEFSEEQKQWFLETDKEEIGGKIDEENKNINNIIPHS